MPWSFTELTRANVDRNLAIRRAAFDAGMPFVRSEVGALRFAAADCGKSVGSAYTRGVYGQAGTGAPPVCPLMQASNLIASGRGTPEVHCRNPPALPSAIGRRARRRTRARPSLRSVFHIIPVLATRNNLHSRTSSKVRLGDRTDITNVKSSARPSAHRRPNTLTADGPICGR